MKIIVLLFTACFALLAFYTACKASDSLEDTIDKIIPSFDGHDNEDLKKLAVFFAVVVLILGLARIIRGYQSDGKE